MAKRKTTSSDKNIDKNIETAVENKSITIYNLAYEYLLNILPDGLKESDLDKYFVGDSRNPESLKDIFIRLITSAQNYQSMPKVINFKERKETIGRILDDYDYVKIAQMPTDNLYDMFWVTFNFKNKSRSYNRWRKWSNAVIDSAKFVSEFTDIVDFKHFIKLFDYNVHTRIALPLYISTKIKGIGFALACDALKELGYLEYPKPDVHIIRLFNELELSSKKPISVFEAVVKMAEDNKVTPYRVDKLLWLICSGRFYKDDKQVGGHRDDFIKYVKGHIKR